MMGYSIIWSLLRAMILIAVARLPDDLSGLAIQRNHMFATINVAHRVHQLADERH